MPPAVPCEKRQGGEPRDENVDGVCSHPCRRAGVGPADGGARDRPRGHPPSGGVAHRPHGAADLGADVPAQHRVRRPERHAAAAVRGEGAGQRAQRSHRADRRHGVRPVQRLRRAHSDADGGSPGQQRTALQAIAWMGYQKALTPDKPFFIYFAPGATHAPHHVPKEWIAKYKGKFDQGWDKVREETLARQKTLGVVPEDAKLAPKPEAIKDWDKLSADEKKLFARQMEVFAGFGEYADFEVGRLVQAIEDLGQMDNTLIFYIAGDNGASAEGSMNGLFNEMTYFNGVPESVPEILKHIDELGGPNSYGHYAAGWAVAGDTPFTWTKQVAGTYGGCRNGMVIHWPQRITAKGEVRSQWHHVIDVAPTILEAAGLPEPKSVNGTPQTPIEGVSMLYTFDDAKAKDRHKTQYFEIFCNRGIYHDGWLAHTVHKAPWESKVRRPLLEDVWELYHVDS